MSPQEVATIEILAACIIGYIVGSVSFAVAVGRYYAVDVLKKGSKNPGATNVTRLLGKTAGQRVFVLDFLKGIFVTGLAINSYAEHNRSSKLGYVGPYVWYTRALLFSFFAF